MSVTIYTGTCTMSVTDNTATITFVSDDTDGGFALLTTGARFECTVGSGTVDSNTGTVITISCWSGDSTTDTISWKGIPPLSNAASASAVLEVLRGLNTLNSLPTGRVMTAAASTTLKRLDALAGGFRFISMSLTAPPDSPAEGDCYLIASDATGGWADEDGNIARYLDSAWLIFAPTAGMVAYNAADGLYYRYTGSAWTADLMVGTSDQTVDGALTADMFYTKSGSFTVPAAGTSVTEVITGLSSHCSYLVTCGYSGANTAINLVGLVNCGDGNNIPNVTTLLSNSYWYGSLSLETYGNESAFAYTTTGGLSFQFTAVSSNTAITDDMTAYWTVTKIGSGDPL